jgi:hypothetical protein
MKLDAKLKFFLQFGQIVVYAAIIVLARMNSDDWQGPILRNIFGRNLLTKLSITSL